MAAHECLRCRSALRQAFHIRQTLTTCKRQPYSSTTTSSKEPAELSATKSTTPPQDTLPKPQLDIAALLSKPTWSVRSLLPPTESTISNTQASSPISNPTTSTTPVTPTQLRHLLRLSALPQPSSPAEEASMLHTLETQLHFVRDIQAVDTTGVEPLVTLRDETEEGIKKATIGLENPRIKEALGLERKVGRMGRVRRRRGAVEDRRSGEEKLWEPLEGARGGTVGRHFVVYSGRRDGSGGGIAEDEREIRETVVLGKPI